LERGDRSRGYPIERSFFNSDRKDSGNRPQPVVFSSLLDYNLNSKVSLLNLAFKSQPCTAFAVMMALATDSSGHIRPQDASPRQPKRKTEPYALSHRPAPTETFP